MKRKYWLGVSDSDDRKPTEFTIYIVGSWDEKEEAKEEIIELIDHDFNCYEEGLLDDDAS
jgi:hypothetical protein